MCIFAKRLHIQPSEMWEFTGDDFEFWADGLNELDEEQEK